jgi:hypothetical protein
MSYVTTGPDDGLNPDISSSRPVGRAQKVAAALSGLLIAGALAVVMFAAFFTGSASPVPAPALTAVGQHSHPLVLPAPCKSPRHHVCGAVTPPPHPVASAAGVIGR